MELECWCCGEEIHSPTPGEWPKQGIDFFLPASGEDTPYCASCWELLT